MNQLHRAHRCVLTLVSLLLVATGLAVGGAWSPAAFAEEPVAPAAGDPDPGRVPDPFVRGVQRDAASTATISGLVRNGRGRLVDGISVEAFSSTDPMGPAVDTAFTYEVGSAVHGAYQLHVPPGSYVLRFSQTDGAPDGYVTAYYGGGAGTAVTVADEESRTLDDMVVRVDPGASVTSQVKDASGNAFPDIEVRLVEVRDGYQRGTVDYAVTGADGSFTLAGARPGRTYTIVAEGSYDANYDDYLGFPDTFLGQQPSVATATTFAGGAAGSTFDVPAITLQAGTTLTGSLVGLEDGDADIYVYVRLPDGSLGYVGGTYVESDDFSFSSVIPGFAYTVSVYPYGGDVVGETWLGDASSSESATFVTPATTGTLAVGTITIGSNTALTTVRVTDQDGGPVSTRDDDEGYSVVRVWERYTYDGSSEWYSIGRPRMRAEGVYGVRLPRGRTFTFSYEEYDADYDLVQQVFLGGASSPFDATTVTPGPTQTAIDAGTIVVTDARTRLTGRVVDENGLPVRGATVGIVVEDCEDEFDCYTYLRRTRETDADGRYTLRGQVGEVVTVGVYGPDSGYDHLVTAPATSTFPATGATTVADLVLTSSPGTVRGRITLPNGTPVSDGGIEVYRFYDYGDGTGDGYFDFYDSASIDEDGTWAVSGLPEGDYALRAYSYDSSFVSTWRGGSRPSTTTDPGVFHVDDSVNPLRGIDLTVDLGVLLSGTITGTDGAPIPYPDVHMHLWQDGQLGDVVSVSSREDGTYRARVDAGAEVWLSIEAGRHVPFYLGGVDHPYDAQTADNTLTVGASGLVYDKSLAFDWAALGTGAGQQLPYCFDSSDDYYSEDIRFGGKDLVLQSSGSIGLSDLGLPSRDLERGEHLPELSVVPGYGEQMSYGVSPDGQTLCVVWESSSYDYETDTYGPGTTAQALVTKTSTGAFSVTYNYDLVGAYSYEGSVDRVGYFDGESTPTVFAGSSTPDGYADGSPTALVDHRLGSSTDGRYTFTFGGFAPRLGGPVSTTEPSVTGDPLPGATVTIDPGTWTLPGGGTAGIEYSHQWYDDHGLVATTPSYTIPADAGGQYIYYNVVAWAPGHEPSRGYGEFVVGPDAATNTAPPTFTPLTNVTVGETLTAEPGSWTPAEGADPLYFRYRWLRDGNPIARLGNRETYVVKPRDVGHRLTVQVSAGSYNGFRLTQPVVSTDSTVVLDAPPVAASTAPTLTGTAKVGQTLTLSPGEWDAGGTEVDLTYRWTVGQRSVTPTASGLAYTLQPADRGQLVTVTVEARATGYSVGRWSRTVGPVVAADVVVAPLTVSVTRGDTAAAVAGAYVYVCDTATYDCFPGGRTGADGTFVVDATGATTYRIYVTSPDDTLRSAELGHTTPASGASTVAVSLTVPTPPPANVAIPTAHGTYDGLPTVYWSEAQTIRVTGCATTASPTYTVTFTDGTPTQTGPMSKGTTTGDLATFSATIPPFYPAHGDTTISTNVPADCAPGTAPTTFMVYIDPSGVVTDQYGFPISGATVTLNRADTVAGPFTVVPDGSDIMSPDNRANPDTTDDIGFFRWDVVEGWYTVTASKPGCVTSTTDPMQVLPARVDLLIKLTCSAPAASPVTPTIAGGTKAGSVLTTSLDAWGTGYDVAVQWLRGATPISGATSTAYTLTGEDVGQTITVRHTAKRKDYVQEEGRGLPITFSSFGVASAGITPTDGDAPTATAPAAPTGSGKVGTTLTAPADPAWSLSGVTTTRQWLRAGTPIEGATASTYAVTPADVGQALTVRYTGTRTGYTNGVVTSAAATGLVGDAPTATAPTAPTGSGKVGTTLTAPADPTWSLGDVTTSRQWLRAGTPIEGATASTYAVTPADVGQALTVRYTGTRTGYTNGVVTSAAVTGLVGDAPTATAPTAPTGSGKVGTTLTAPADPTWSLSGVTTTRQWLRGGVPIVGAVSDTYEVTPGDVDQAITVAFVGTRSGYTDGSVTSAAATGLVGDAPTATAPAAPTGPGKVGTTLTAPADPTWSLSGVTTTRQWLRAGTPIEGATGSTYAVTPADVGQALTVRYTGTRTGYTDGVVASAASTGLVGDAATATALPAITGTAKAGEVLTASTGTWSAEGLAYSYRWERDDAAITGATSATYTLTKADVGRTITVTVTAARTGFQDGAATSAGVVAKRSAACDTATSKLTAATAALTKAKATVTKAAKKVASLSKKLKAAQKKKQTAKVAKLKKQVKSAKAALTTATKAQVKATTAQKQAQTAVTTAC